MRPHRGFHTRTGQSVRGVSTPLRCHLGAEGRCRASRPPGVSGSLWDPASPAGSPSPPHRHGDHGEAGLSLEISQVLKRSQLRRDLRTRAWPLRPTSAVRPAATAAGSEAGLPLSCKKRTREENGGREEARGGNVGENLNGAN